MEACPLYIVVFHLDYINGEGQKGILVTTRGFKMLSKLKIHQN